MIDRVLRDMLTHHRPGYLMLPADVESGSDCPARAYWWSPLRRMKTSSPGSENMPAACCGAADAFLCWRISWRSAMACRTRSGVGGENADRPCHHANGQGLFDEQLSGFVGTYSGIASAPQTREAIENADTIICIGTRFTDTITAGFTQHLARERPLRSSPSPSGWATTGSAACRWIKPWLINDLSAPLAAGGRRLRSWRRK
jgi:indolepyruvate decarboxylase